MAPASRGCTVHHRRHAAATVADVARRSLPRPPLDRASTRLPFDRNDNARGVTMIHLEVFLASGYAVVLVLIGRGFEWMALHKEREAIASAEPNDPSFTHLKAAQFHRGHLPRRTARRGHLLPDSLRHSGSGHAVLCHHSSGRPYLGSGELCPGAGLSADARGAGRGLKPFR